MNRLYFHCKPYLPRKVRLAARRVHARRIRQASAGVWPILESAARATPEGWSGWPEGKEFAFVLTHDVESSDGVAKVRALAELEMACGFRSSFNFIPDGTYQVPQKLRSWLAENGFEVGVHDLHHDGHLYKSRQRFRQHAKEINGYIDRWKAKGFRSGFMLRELEWLHDLDIQYDASTFDTDPFEPQPDGAGTIFPYWKHARSGSPRTPEYVELPYTLPQDSTLFLALSERDISIWKTKFDWVSENRGMVLLNTHPDYIDFAGGANPNEFYPESYYTEFLNYVRSVSGDRFWHALPREVAEFMKLAPSGSGASRNGRNGGNRENK